MRSFAGGPSKNMVSSAASLTLCCSSLLLTGCLERRISITTEPPGALVWVNDVEIGRTPVDTDFVFYGDYDVRLRKDGYEPITTHIKANAPWYEIPPFDFVATAMPFNIDTDLKWHFDLKPAESKVLGREESEKGVMERARELRGQLEHPPEGGSASQNKSEAKPAEAVPAEENADKPAETPAEPPKQI